MTKMTRLNTLEPQIVEVNSPAVLNKVLGTSFKTKQEFVDYMIANKTECALAIFETGEKVIFPKYVQEAVS